MFAREELEGVLVNALNQPLGILFARACYHGEECDDGAKILYAIKQMDLDMMYSYLHDAMRHIRVCDGVSVKGEDMWHYAEKIEADDIDNDSCAMPKVWNEKAVTVGFFERQRVEDDAYFATKGYRFYISETGRLLTAHEHSCTEFGSDGKDFVIHTLTYSQPSDCCDKFMLNEVKACMSIEQERYWSKD